MSFSLLILLLLTTQSSTQTWQTLIVLSQSVLYFFCISETPLSTMSDTNGAPKFVLWHYSPSVIAAAIAAALFGLLTIANLVRLIQKRTWFCIPLVIGGLCKYQHFQATTQD